VSLVDLTTIQIGKTYSRPFLADLWGYKSYNAISRGVFTPKDQKLIILFVTKEKQESLTQYEDHIEQDILFWEGEEKHKSDNRIISKQDEIHVFYRERHHSDFIYEGRAILNHYQIRQDKPSKFTYFLIDQRRRYTDIVAEIQNDYRIQETERETIIKARKGQGLYRKLSVDLWNQCSVTGFKKQNLLIASHIKPWKFSNNVERIDPYNSLLLVPTIDKLFDKGYISFDFSGKILLSEKITEDDYQRIYVTPDLRLRNVFTETKPFLEYHNEYIFDLVDR